MISKKIDNQYRKDVVLGIVINEYIKTVNPVSSSLIANDYIMELSPATIRIILSDLESEGYLTHPHTSAGRIPTQEGYRYYVDYLMNEIYLLEEEKFKIKSEYEKNIQDLENILEKTSQVISEMTQYISIVSVDGRSNRLYCKGLANIIHYLNPQDVSKIQDILTIIEEKERILEIMNRDLLKKIDIYIGHEIACATIEDCSLAVSSYKTNNGVTGRLAVLGPTCMDYQRVKSALDYFSGFMSNLL